MKKSKIPFVLTPQSRHRNRQSSNKTEKKGREKEENFHVV